MIDCRNKDFPAVTHKPRSNETFVRKLLVSGKGLLLDVGIFYRHDITVEANAV